MDAYWFRWLDNAWINSILRAIRALKDKEPESSGRRYSSLESTIFYDPKDENFGKLRAIADKG